MPFENYGLEVGGPIRIVVLKNSRQIAMLIHSKNPSQLQNNTH